MNTAQLTLLDHHLSEARRAAHLNQTRPTDDERFRDLVAKFDFRKLIDALTHVGPNGHRPGLQDGVEREVCEEAVRGLPGPAGVLDPIAPVVPWLAFAQRDVSDAASGGG